MKKTILTLLFLCILIPSSWGEEKIFTKEMPYFVICPYCYSNKTNLKFMQTDFDRAWYCSDSDYIFNYKQNKIINSAIHYKFNIDADFTDYVKSLEARIEALEEGIKVINENQLQLIKGIDYVNQKEKDEKRACNRIHPANTECNICYTLDKPR